MTKKEIDEISLENLSHYIKTPLSIIMGYCEIMLGGLSGEMNSEQMDYMKKIKSEVRNIDDFLNTFLDNVEKGIEENIKEKVNIDIVSELKDVFMIIYTNAEKREVYTDLIVPDKKIYLNADNNIQKAFLIIIQQIVKYTCSNQHLKIILKEKNTNSFDITIYASEYRYIEELDKLNDDFLFITAEKYFKSSGFDISIEHKKVRIDFYV